MTDAIIIIVALIVGFSLSYAFVHLGRALRNVASFVRALEGEMMPILSNLNQTIEEINNEIERVNELVERVEEISEKVSAATVVVREIISSPVVKIASFSAGAKKALSTFVRGA